MENSPNQHFEASSKRHLSVTLQCEYRNIFYIKYTHTHNVNIRTNHSSNNLNSSVTTLVFGDVEFPLKYSKVFLMACDTITGSNLSIKRVTYFMSMNYKSMSMLMLTFASTSLSSFKSTLSQHYSYCNTVVITTYLKFPFRYSFCFYAEIFQRFPNDGCLIENGLTFSQ